MAFIGENFMKAVPSSLGPIFQFASVPVSGLEVWLENLSSDNSVTWKVQDSDDGTNWTDREFNTTDCNTTATTFTLVPEKSQSVRITKKKAYVRLVASALTGTNLNVKVDWSVPFDSDAVRYIQG